jgi:hypothetical protein
VVGCTRQVNSAWVRYCVMHRNRFRRWGHPGQAVPKISNRWVCHIKNSGYKVFKIGNKSEIPEHRLIVERHLGRPLRRFEHVHHINGIRSDNRIENLQIWCAPSKASDRTDGQPYGQRPEDLVEFVLEFYPDLVLEGQFRRAAQAA